MTTLNMCVQIQIINDFILLFLIEVMKILINLQWNIKLEYLYILYCVVIKEKARTKMKKKKNNTDDNEHLLYMHKRWTSLTPFTFW